MQRLIKVYLMGVLIFFICSVAYAADEPKEGDWEFGLAPMYLWAMNMTGDMGVGPIDTSVDVDFGDILDTLELVFTVHFEALYKNQGGVFLDYTYINLEETQTTPGRALKMDTTIKMAEFGGFYRFNNGPHDFDVLAGGRLMSLDVELDPQGPIPIVINRDKMWVDPIVGARWLWDVTDKWKMSLRGDIGGFGVGSDFAWNLVGLIHFKPWKHVSIVGGYRVLDIDYDDSDAYSRFEMDTTMHGPMFGINITW